LLPTERAFDRQAVSDRRRDAEHAFGWHALIVQAHALNPDVAQSAIDLLHEKGFVHLLITPPARAANPCS
jgi:hypothetical protein